MKNKLTIAVTILLLNIAVGGWSVNEILSWFGKNIPFAFDIILGLITGSISIPVAIVGLILKVCGVF